MRSLRLQKHVKRHWNQNTRNRATSWFRPKVPRGNRYSENMYKYEVTKRAKVETPDFAHAVLRHWLCKPIKLLMVPPIPTMPSSRSRYLSAETGEVKSQTSESSWVRAVERSLEQTMLATMTNMEIGKRGAHTFRSSWPPQRPRPPCGQPSSPSLAISTASTDPRSH